MATPPAFPDSGMRVNNAALVNRNAQLWKVPASEFSMVVDVNIKGVANVIRHFVPAMVAKRSGVIINFSSGWGRSTDAEVAPYCATKWAKTAVPWLLDLGPKDNGISLTVGEPH